MIGIIDYGMGNLFSVSKALERLDTPYFISEKRGELQKADGLILPGVGSFEDAMELLERLELASLIKEYVQLGKPLLGICLGMQLLFEESEENGLTKGLQLLPGSVRRFPGVSVDGVPYKVPHMGWNRLTFVQPSELLQSVHENYAYFVHSYYVDTDDKSIVIAESSYDVKVPAVVGKENIFGMQFHPEKSGQLGMELLSNFTGIVWERMTEK
ncbi:imidazole glycerol phosphate synthase subunit HisH [Bacillus sp. DTU_2020_1000418_1_SI_GHA_SEK_038]|uniref:imidazole glycerol phosphate synthase subunit HisH n=1 Tax=Bacillus sp. DTU_2020_1000418_1_SI_GHA_SEK_038 TaxID=3077585 RepID=UPI0028E32C3B|nr:imidazole glycerol phosphate synthase subunit HisH [Bacillus sp. DTU_2020_1000418_1_SI_GHA_SEK_038]WNS75037.1 imidazole glycerol phosphate synthase subunit HisH [Bacillus sp. DTU_2020_1000418_1_SI_GHA_SEK_038]